MKKSMRYGYIGLGVCCLATALAITGCNGENEESILSSPSEIVSYEDSPQLIEYRQSCYEILDTYVNLNSYRELEKTEIRNLIEQAKTEIANAHTIIDADDALNRYLELIDQVKTDEDYRKTEVPTYENSTSTELSRYYKNLGYESIYDDINFREPILVSKPIQDAPPYYYSENLLDYYHTGKTEYGWEIAQWASRYNLIEQEGDSDSGYEFNSISDDGLTYTLTSKGVVKNDEFVPAKQITFNTATGAFRLISNCSVEYAKKERENDWVHLLLQQNWPAEDKYLVSSKESIIMESELIINKCDNCVGDDYKPAANAAQVVWYLQLRNKNSESEGYGQAFWFGIGVWDNRYVGTITPQYANHDNGTGTIIVSPGSSETYASRRGFMPDVGEKIKISLDVLPLMREAFITARERGYLSKTDFTDLYMTHTNFGFEMPGVFDIDVSYDSIGVFAK